MAVAGQKPETDLVLNSARARLRGSLNDVLPNADQTINDLEQFIRARVQHELNRRY